jgi:hypothetical protein
MSRLPDHEEPAAAVPEDTGSGLQETAPARHGAPRPAAARPDPTRLRFALGAGGLATLSALVTAIVTPAPGAPAVPAGAGATSTTDTPATIAAQRPVQYVKLAPGQSPPAGATVIDAKAPKPITIVTRVPAPAPQTVVVRTTQSGKPLP